MTTDLLTPSAAARRSRASRTVTGTLVDTIGNGPSASRSRIFGISNRVPSAEVRIRDAYARHTGIALGVLYRPWQGDPRFTHSGSYKFKWDLRIVVLCLAVAVVIVVIHAVL